MSGVNESARQAHFVCRSARVLRCDVNHGYGWLRLTDIDVPQHAKSRSLQSTDDEQRSVGDGRFDPLTL